MNTVYEYVPFKRVGQLVFGMKRSDVRKLCGAFRASMYGVPIRNRYLDDFGSFHGMYTPYRRLEAVSLFPEVDIEIQGTRIHIGKDAHPVVEQLKAILDDVRYVELDESFVSEKAGIVIFCPNGEIENVLFYSEHYYDAENKYLQKKFGVTKFHY